MSGKITTTSREEVIKNVQILLNAHGELKIFNKMGYFLSLLEQHSKSFTSNIVYYKSLFMIPRYYIEGIFILFVIFSFNIFTFIGLSTIEIYSVLIIYVVSGIRLFPSCAALVSSLMQVNNSLFALKKVSNEIKKYKIIDFNNQKISKEFKEKTTKDLFIKNVSFSFERNKKLIFKKLNFVFKPKTFLSNKRRKWSWKVDFIKFDIRFVYTKFW